MYGLCRRYAPLQCYKVISYEHPYYSPEFPGQFKHLSPALVPCGDRVNVLTLKVKKRSTWQGAEIILYKIVRSSSKGIYSWQCDLETKVIRAESCLNAAIQLRDLEFSLDVILAHHGWVEPMFRKDV